MKGRLPSPINVVVANQLTRTSSRPMAVYCFIPASGRSDHHRRLWPRCVNWPNGNSSSTAARSPAGYANNVFPAGFHPYFNRLQSVKENRGDSLTIAHTPM